ncbi:hypothetical protein HPP92_021433 [Vanilla planifolia]|uniref:Glycosyltransferase n=1 Tax=Vanilla planifolia TaxID=51239 RepID=A0A835Q7Z9_VANPL|nr:hypothetical protein HPP92_021433 [Vanilla planifolia]
MEQPAHFLVITFPAQGHLNPALHLAKCLARLPNARVTFSTGAFAHRVMFPSSPEAEVDDGLLTYIPFADGSSGKTNAQDKDLRNFVEQVRRLGSQHFDSILRDLAARGRPVTLVIHTIMLQWASDVAGDLGISSTLYWIQAATVLGIYHHFFNGHKDYILSHAKNPSLPISLPGLPPFQFRDLPDILLDTDPTEFLFGIFEAFREVFNALSRSHRPKVLVNSFDELEAGALLSMGEHMELITVGPVLPEDAAKTDTTADIFEQDEKDYMDWLNSQAERSVVYISFGSVHKMVKEDVEEISRGLRESKRPYLWVVRKDGKEEGLELEEEDEAGKNNGLVVAWCSQLKVLAHRAVGCFVTHCGWNSTLEGLVSGVPAVAIPKWSDQHLNARLMERWGTAVSAEEGEDGRVGADELRRCLDVVMGQGEKGVEIRRKAEWWKKRAQEAFSDDGSSGRNLRSFVEEVIC